MFSIIDKFAHAFGSSCTDPSRSVPNPWACPPALGLGWATRVTIARRPDTVDLAGAEKFGDASPIIDLEARSELCHKLAVGSPGTQREAPCAQMWTPSSSGPGLSALRSRAP